MMIKKVHLHRAATVILNEARHCERTPRPHAAAADLTGVALLYANYTFPLKLYHFCVLLFAFHYTLSSIGFLDSVQISILTINLILRKLLNIC